MVQSPLWVTMQARAARAPCHRSTPILQTATYVLHLVQRTLATPIWSSTQLPRKLSKSISLATKSLIWSLHPSMVPKRSLSLRTKERRSIRPPMTLRKVRKWRLASPHQTILVCLMSSRLQSHLCKSMGKRQVLTLTISEPNDLATPPGTCLLPLLRQLCLL